MAQERKRVMGELMAVHLAGVVAHIPFTGRELSVEEANPYRVIPPHLREQMARIREFQAKRMWRARFGGSEG